MEGDNINSRGFTLLELSLALGMMALIAAFTVPNFLTDFTERNANLTSGELQSISEAARLFAVKNGGHWPSEDDDCASALDELKATNQNPGAITYLAAVNETSPFGTQYFTSCNAERTLFQIEVKSSEEAAQIISNAIPLTEILPGLGAIEDTTRTHVTLPGSVVQSQGLLHRFHDAGLPVLNEMNTPIIFKDEQGRRFQIDAQGISRLKTVKSIHDKSFALDIRGADDGIIDAADIPGAKNGSISLNDVQLRSLDGKFLSDIISRPIKFASKGMIKRCDKKSNRCRNEKVNLTKFVGKASARMALVRVRLCGSVRDKAFLNDSNLVSLTMSSGANTKEKEEVIASMIFGARTGGGEKTAAVSCQNTQHFIPVNNDKTFLVNFSSGKFINKNTVLAEIYLEGYSL